ncbi:MAG: DUF3109 family protein [Bacteroidales bacterium]|nr:DUF3109 family protein [Bacteroidales bacterium]
MIEIDDKIVSLDLIEKHFQCDLSQCKGQCCVEGDGGAPLSLEEIDIIEANYSVFSQFMTAEGKNAIEEQGFFTIDEDGDRVTPLINNQACAYVAYEGDIALCAIEKAFNKKLIDFQKPISCHLYPIRTKQYKEFLAVNYHQWNICKPALKKGKQTQTPMYRFLESPVKRAFGEDFYQQLKIAEEYFKQSND